jgi:hypothetical protein
MTTVYSDRRLLPQVHLCPLTHPVLARVMDGKGHLGAASDAGLHLAPNPEVAPVELLDPVALPAQRRRTYLKRGGAG